MDAPSGEDEGVREGRVGRGRSVGKVDQAGGGVGATNEDGEGSGERGCGGGTGEREGRGEEGGEHWSECVCVEEKEGGEKEDGRDEGEEK